jgi:hypothetical protein
MKQVTVNLDFSKVYESRPNDGMVGSIILKALKSKKIKIIKFRYTYVESKYGISEMPRDLILASFINDHYKGFEWYLDRLSGKYTFTFKN